MTDPLTVRETETDAEPLKEDEGDNEGECEEDCVTRPGRTVSVTEIVSVEEAVASFALALGEGERDGEADTESEGVPEPVGFTDTDTVKLAEGVNEPVFVTLMLGDTEGEPEEECVAESELLAHAEWEAVRQVVGDDERDDITLPVRNADAVRAPVPVENRLGVCVGDSVSTRAVEERDAVTEREGVPDKEGETEGELDGEIVATVEPVRMMLSVAPKEMVGDTEAEGVEVEHTDAVNVALGQPEVVTTVEAVAETLGHAELDFTLDGEDTTVKVTEAQ